MLRLVLALPYLIPVFVTAGRADSVDTPNQQLLDHIASIDWGRADIAWVGDIYPPLSTLLAAVVPGGRFGLGIIGALVAGVFLQKMVEIMVQRRFSPWLTTILILALAANPLFAYTATENLPAFLGLAFFGLGIADIVRFVAWGNTQSGFRAGMYLMLATLCDLTGLVYVLTSAVAAPFLRLGRNEQPGARAANVLVILYPTLAALASLIALNTIFTGNPIGEIGLRLNEGVADRWAALLPLFQSPNGWLLAAPVLSAWLVAVIVRRPGSILVSTLVFYAVLGSFVIGLLPSGSAGNTFILMTLMAIALVPAPRTRLTFALMDCIGVIQIAIAWTTAFNRQIVLDWINAIAGTSFIPLFG
ncbi:MAG: hypothetical protein JWP32_2204 [Schumannella sp.]|nr:hypothetical protein [Schumannella sp.]